MLSDVHPAGRHKELLTAEINRLATLEPERSDRLNRLLNITHQVREATERTVTFSQPIFCQDGEPVIWPRTVNLIQGQTGVHKSRVAELFGSAVLASEQSLEDRLGIEFHPNDDQEYRLIYVDTERNTSDQLPYAMQGLKIRAGYTPKEHPKNFHYTSLVGEIRIERFSALNEFLEYHRNDFQGHLIVILDVLSDCVSDFNDVSASLQLMDLLNVAVNEKDVTFLAVIHENPGGTTNKARGHLGTEAGNKASTVLQLSPVKEGGKPTPLVQLQYLKRRYAAPGLVFHAVYDEFKKSLVRAEAPQGFARLGGSQRKVSEEKILSLIPAMLATGPVPTGQLEEELSTKLSVCSRTVNTYLKKLLKPGTSSVKDIQGRDCFLLQNKAAKGLIKLYTLEPVPNTD